MSEPNPKPKSPEQMLPPRLQLYRAFDQAYDRFTEEMRSDEDARQEMDSVGSMDRFSSLAKDKELVITLDDNNDSVIPFRKTGGIRAVNLARERSGMYRLLVANDSSDEMLTLNDAGHATHELFDHIDIIAGTEALPFLVTASEIDLASAEEYLRHLQEEGQEPDYLNDEEAQKILLLLRNTFADPGETRVQNDLDMWPE